MTYIPDCRNDGRIDEAYNQKYLNDQDAEFVAGYDWCRIHSIENFFDNIDIYETEFEDNKEVRFYELLEDDTIREKLKAAMVHYSEMERDELITSMIENMNDEEFEKIKEEIDEGKRENCLAKYQFEKDDQENWKE